jgi:hypothetical protein
MDLITLILSAGVTTAIVSGAVQITLWRLNRGASKEDKRDDGEKAVRHALTVILYDRIKYRGRKHVAAGQITLEDLEDLMAMHRIYHDDLKGNGFLDTIMSQVKRLPTVD